VIDEQKSPKRCFNFVWTSLLAAALYGGTAYAQGTVPPPVFFTAQQYQTSQARNQLEPGGLASCTVPDVTITHSPGYVVPTSPPQTLQANLASTPNAVCNDGTAVHFLFRPGYGVAASRWVIYLEGGGECHDQPTCMKRQTTGAPVLTSNEPYIDGTAKMVPLAGILSPDPAQNPDFYDANLVQIAYCSSDEWMGEKQGNTAMTPAQIRQSMNVDNWYFDGHGVVEGVIQLLQTKYGLNNASDVLFAGGSAGASGVFMNADYVSGLLPLQTRFAALPDSGYHLSTFPDYDPATGGEAPPPTNEQTWLADGQSLWASIGDFDCAYASNQAGEGYNNLACDFADQLTQNATYRVPLFIRSSYHDDTILNMFNVTEPITPEEQPYVTSFDIAMAQSLGLTNAWLSVFGLNITTHTMIKNSDFTDKSFTSPGNSPTTLAAAVGVWYRNPCAAPRWLQRSAQE
jgi:hypothetical protein